MAPSKSKDTFDSRKTRNRVPTSCFTCRRKKIKCNKEKPFCSSCVQNQTTQFCTYEVQPWQPSLSPSNDTSQAEIKALKAKIKQLEGELISLKDHNTGSTEGSLVGWQSNTTLYDNNNMDDLVEKFGGFKIKDAKLMYFGPTSYMSVSGHDKHFKRMLADYYQDQQSNFDEFSETVPLNKLQCSYGKIDETEGTTKPRQVTNELPPVHIIKILIKRFFKYCYNFAPFIDKDSFMKELIPILTTINNKTKISAIGVKPYSTISMLLVMLRFAYITLPFKDFYDNNLIGEDLEIMKEVTSNNIEITPSYIDCAHQFTVAIGAFSRVNLRTIQAALLLRVYKAHCPEDDDTWTDSGVLLGIIIQMARYHGINRNPSTYPKSFLNSKAELIWRKIWIFLWYYDATHSFHLGSQPLINPSMEDALSTSIMDMSMESGDSPSVNLQITNIALIAKASRKVIDMLQDKKSINYSDLVHGIEELNGILNNKIRTFSQLYNFSGAIFNTYPVDRAQEFVLRINLYGIIFLNYFLLSQIAGKEGNSILENKYLALAFENALVVLRIGDEFADNPAAMFGAELEMMVASQIWKACQKVFSSISTVIFRSLEGEFSIIDSIRSFKSADSAGISTWIKVDFNSELESAKNFYAKYEELGYKLERLSSKYFICFRICAGMRHLLNYVDKFYPVLKQTNKDYQLNSFAANAGMDFADLEQFWNRKQFDEPVMDFDFIMSHMNFNSDFMNDVPTGLAQ